ncbi:hypothetical protein SAMN04487906_2656 [Zhouia amylolytica]|uniref:Uncharacterized protein n=2 Tax=Zhouia amylolytica TaxID=376730 RepID=A0A1I6UQY0_9FLAO|nr:hypothetical protein SAMN04487906_2656 [Zhouia amylolytica]
MLISIPIKRLVDSVKYSSKQNSRIFLFEVFLGVFIVVSPFLIRLNELFPKNSFMKLFGFRVEVMVSQGMDVVSYLVLSKLIPIILLSIWYFTCRSWWRWSLIFLINVNMIQCLHILFREFDVTIFHANKEMGILYSMIIPVTVISLCCMLIFKKVRLKAYFKLSSDVYAFQIDDLINKSKFLKGDLQYLRNKSRSIRASKNYLNQKEYLKKLSKLSIKVKKRYGEGVTGSEKTRPKLNAAGVITSVFLLATPILYYVYRFVPQDFVAPGSLIGDAFDNDYASVLTVVWLLGGKLYLVVLLSIWYITNENWWKFAILSPVSVTIIQIIDIVNLNSVIDEQSIWGALPYLLPILFVLIWISGKVNYYFSIARLQTLIESEITQLVSIINNERRDKIRDQLISLKEGKKRMSSEEYLEKLLVLQEEVDR